MWLKCLKSVYFFILDIDLDLAGWKTGEKSGIQIKGPSVGRQPDGRSTVCVHSSWETDIIFIFFHW